ncbi:MAG TPA: hypothetical protein VKV95_13335 [Terriglobia bacterium]|nr:hypothetical protein [Terriglobia bacterium]
MKPKYTLILAFFLALFVGALAPISASARERHRVHVYFSYGTPSYYYQPAPVYYYQPEPNAYYYRYHREHWRRYHRDRGWHRGWDRD